MTASRTLPNLRRHEIGSLLLGGSAGAASVLDPLGMLIAFIVVLFAVARTRQRLRVLGLLLTGAGAGATIALVVLGAHGSIGLGVSGSSYCPRGQLCSAHQHALLSIPALLPSVATLAAGTALVWKSQRRRAGSSVSESR